MENHKIRGVSRTLRKIGGASRDRGKLKTIEDNRGKIEENQGLIDEIPGRIKGKTRNCVFLDEPVLGNFRGIGIVRIFCGDGLCG